MAHTVEYWPLAGFLVTTIAPAGGEVLFAARTTDTNDDSTAKKRILIICYRLQNTNGSIFRRKESTRAR